MVFSLQMIAFVDDLGYTVQIGTEVGFTEDAGNLLPSGIGDASYVVDKMHNDGYTVEMVMIRYESDTTDEPRFTRISPEVRITCNKDQIGAI